MGNVTISGDTIVWLFMAQTIGHALSLFAVGYVVKLAITGHGFWLRRVEGTDDDRGKRGPGSVQGFGGGR